MDANDFRYFLVGEYGNVFAALAPKGRFYERDNPFGSGTLNSVVGAIGLIEDKCRGFAPLYARPNSAVSWRGVSKARVRRHEEVAVDEARERHPALFELIDSSRLDQEIVDALDFEKEEELERKMGAERFARYTERRALKERNETAERGETPSRSFEVEQGDWRAEVLIEAFLLAAETNPNGPLNYSSRRGCCKGLPTVTLVAAASPH